VRFVVFGIETGNKESNLKKKAICFNFKNKICFLTKQLEQSEEIFWYQSIEYHYQSVPRM